MSEFLFHAHSGLRYLVLLAGVVAGLYALIGWVRRGRYDAWARVLTRVFVGFLDAQVLLGIILLFLRPFYPQLIGHVVMMVLAALVAHATAVMNKRRPEGRKSFGIMFFGILVALGTIAGGIMALGRSIV